MRRRCTALLVLVLAACTERGQDPHAAEPSGPRVVSLHDVTTEMVVALAATPRLVGIAEPVDASSEIARAVAHVPRVGGLESILLLQPDVVLGLGVVAERDPELVSRLRERGIDVFLADPVRLDDVYELTRAVARRTGTTAAAEALIARLRERLERDGPVPARRRRVFVYDCCDPPFTAGGQTVLTDLIDRSGGQNVFAELRADWTHVSWEEVVARRPELVVIHAYQYEGQGNVPAKLRTLRAIPALADVPVAVIPLGWSLGGLRSAEAVERLRTAIGGQI
jgi:iron complex transport system substrate-binding protein